MEGPRGTAKTRTILSLLIASAIKYPGTRLVLCRKFRAVLAETVLKTLQEEVLPIFGLSSPAGSRDNWREYNVDRPDAKFTINFVGLDDSRVGGGTEALKSAAFSRGYIAEATELTETEVLSIAASMRWTKSEERPKLPPYPQIVLDCNPGAPANWLNHRAEDVPNPLRLGGATRDGYEAIQCHNRAPVLNPDKWKRIITRHQDNIGYWDAEAWTWREQGKQYVTETLSQYNGHTRDRWVNGIWRAAEGSVYPQFSDELNVWQPPAGMERLYVPADWPLYWAIDPGMDHPAAVLWFTVAPTVELIVVDEIVVSGVGTDELVPMVKKVEDRNGWSNREISRYGDPQYSFSSTAMSKRTIAEQWKDKGVIMHPWPRTGDNMDGMVDAVRTLINTRKLIIMANCPKTIAAVQSWSFKRNRDGTPSGAKGKDAYEEEYKDPNDCVRGIVALKPAHSRADVVKVY